ncbi:hypothetical protein SS05631_b51640 (plasmid) [Sinorhizobium sp. CCBAU 05631]|nr:hypothetical protein SS05631_b51640 [Sinorhizobium sp. CCBAU 05631]
MSGHGRDRMTKIVDRVFQEVEDKTPVGVAAPIGTGNVKTQDGVKEMTLGGSDLVESLAALRRARAGDDAVVAGGDSQRVWIISIYKPVATVNRRVGAKLPKPVWARRDPPKTFASVGEGMQRQGVRYESNRCVVRADAEMVVEIKRQSAHIALIKTHANPRWCSETREAGKRCFGCFAMNAFLAFKECGRPASRS